LLQLFGGLALFGFSMALIVRSELGNIPWDVLHQGVSEQTGLSFGTVVVVVGGATQPRTGWAISPGGQVATPGPHDPAGRQRLLPLE